MGGGVFRKSDVAQVAFYFVGVVDGGADLQYSTALFGGDFSEVRFL